MKRYAYMILFTAFMTFSPGCTVGSDPSSENTDRSTAGLAKKQTENRPPSFHPDSHFTSPEDFFKWVNTTREQYASHPRDCGHPNDRTVKVAAMGNPVFPLTFVWDDGLALRAQKEVDGLAQGGKPTGVQFTDQGFHPVEAWGSGYFTGDWMLSAFEDVTLLPPFRPMTQTRMTRWEFFPLGPQNGMARVGLWFQDFGETGPVITRLGIGASATEKGTWWVLQFGK